MFGLQPNLASIFILLIVTGLGMVAFIPQVVKLIRTKSADDISMGSWVMWLIAYILMTIYSVVFTRDLMLCVAYASETLASGLIILLTIRYQRKNKG